MIQRSILFFASLKAINCFLPYHHNKNSFLPRHQEKSYHERTIQHHQLIHSTTRLFGGIGTTANYTWKEDQFEIEIKIPVPSETKTRHVAYKPKSKSIELSIEIEPNEKQILLHGSRQFRGMIDLDGTFWSLHDSEETGNDNRELVVSIEKLIVPHSDPFAVIDYDWGSVYLNDEKEILSKKYDEPEELDIKEYAASLGVDIDNINMTMVDKSMFSSGLNLTRNTLEELTKSGYVKEVTKQGDGMEFIEEGQGSDRKSIPFKKFGDHIGDDEIEGAGIIDRTFGKMNEINNPLLDTNSPWRQSMPVEEARGVHDDDSLAHDDNEETQSDESNIQSSNSKIQDPVDRLTVSKLKEILRKEGLKVSGNKQELQDRLKDHVNSKIQRNRGGNKENPEDENNDSFQ